MEKTSDNGPFQSFFSYSLSLSISNVFHWLLSHNLENLLAKKRALDILLGKYAQHDLFYSPKWRRRREKEPNTEALHSIINNQSSNEMFASCACWFSINCEHKYAKYIPLSPPRSHTHTHSSIVCASDSLQLFSTVQLNCHCYLLSIGFSSTLYLIHS